MQHTVSIRFVSEPLSTWVSMVPAPGEILFNRAALSTHTAAYQLLASVFAALGENTPMPLGASTMAQGA